MIKKLFITNAIALLICSTLTAQTPAAAANASRRGTSQGVEGAKLNYTPGQAPKLWSAATAEMVMARYPDYRQAYWKAWSYVQGYMFHGFDLLYKSTGDKKYLDYMKKYIDNFVDEQGNYKGDRPNNLDNIMTGTTIVALYEHTKDERYKTAAGQLRKAFDTYPRSKDGQFWHGSGSPNMWIDGVFMGQMFLIRYGQVIGDTEYTINEAAKQIMVCAKHSLKGETGLYLHGWSEAPAKTRWADTITGLSPEVWSEGLGWYALVVPELLAVMPQNHANYAAVKDIYLKMCAGLKKVQNPKTGGWFMVVDKVNEPKNWIDPSGTAMFVYSIQRGIDLGLLNKNEYKPVVEKAYKNLLEYAEINKNGLVDIHGTGDGISIKHNYETYITYPKRVNAKEAVGGFLWATAIMEQTQLKKVKK